MAADNEAIATRQRELCEKKEGKKKTQRIRLQYNHCSLMRNYLKRKLLGRLCMGVVVHAFASREPRRTQRQ